MTVSQKGELLFFIASFLFGVGNGILYDGFRFLRMLLGVRRAGNECPQKNKERGKLSLAGVVTFLLDFLCILIGGVLYTLFLYEAHSGIFRFYSLLALGLGTLLYLKTLSRVTLFLLAPAAVFLKRLANGILYPSRKFFRAIFRVFLKLLRKMRCFSHKIVLNYKRKEKKRNKRKSQTKMEEKSTVTELMYSFGKR